MTKKCPGCINIKESNFPFLYIKESGEIQGTEIEGCEIEAKGFFIDQEHQGINGKEYLKIEYCPVCGKKLK